MRTSIVGRVLPVCLTGVFMLAAFAFGALSGDTARLQAQQPQAVQSTLVPRFISLAPEFAQLFNDAAYEINGGGDLGGVALPNTGFPRFAVGFTLPPDYAPGTDLTMRILWGNSRNNAIVCGFVLWNNGVIAYRPDQSAYAHIGVATFPGGADKITLVTPSTSEQVRVTTLTIAGQDSGGGARYQPGDAFSVMIARRVDDAPDTCTGKMFILGLDVTYNGLTTYAPLIQR